MEITRLADDSQCTLKLKGDMTIYTAMENKPHFEPYFNNQQNIFLNMSAVNEFDSTGFQMLLLLERQAINNDNTFCVNECSPAVQEVLTLYNKKKWFQ